MQEIIKKKGGQYFVIGDTKKDIDAVEGRKSVGDPCSAIIALHTDSVNTHYPILKNLTTTIHPGDDLYAL